MEYVCGLLQQKTSTSRIFDTTEKRKSCSFGE
ncbi:uncharacterized protein G2W53_030168 [Senna tora]|uniref:Uncharacterized protein n=1 Tax=Senna tora TaxID=362788 RepID=A0A834WGG9_9FABA|nr:uncharacterized protein G2W53_030168 [Senna tora]